MWIIKGDIRSLDYGSHEGPPGPPILTTARLADFLGFRVFGFYGFRVLGV